jgi:hypothetical protein
MTLTNMQESAMQTNMDNASMVVVVSEKGYVECICDGGRLCNILRHYCAY